MKLQQGDYVTNLTEEQFDELMEIEGEERKLTYISKSKTLGYDGQSLYKMLFERITELPFEEFKQRAINTFKDETN